jgi:Transmembrane domain of unknown function (DUF3566)
LLVLQRRRGIRVRQRIRRLELWPVFKLALAFHAVCGAISLGVVTLLWRLGDRAGFTDRMTNFLVDIGFADSVKISGAALFRGATTIAVALALHNTVVTLLLAVLYNLLSGLLGGLIISVVEDDMVRPIRKQSGRAASPKQSDTRIAKPIEQRSGSKSTGKVPKPPRPTQPASAPSGQPVTPSRAADEDQDETDWITNLGDHTMDEPFSSLPSTPLFRPLADDVTGKTVGKPNETLRAGSDDK